MPVRTPRATAHACLACLIILFAPAIPAAAAEFYWYGQTGDPFWSTPCNWVPCGAPPNDGTATVVFRSPAFRHEPYTDVNWSVHGIRIEGNESFLLSGSSLTLGAGGVQMTGSAPSMFFREGFLESHLGASQTWSNTGSAELHWAGLLQFPLVDLTISTGGGSGTGNVTLEGALIGLESELFKIGPDTLKLRARAGEGNFEFQLTVLEGTVLALSDRVIPDAYLVVVRSAVLDLNGFGATLGGSPSGLVMGTYPTDGSGAGRPSVVISPGLPLKILTNTGPIIQYDATGLPGPAAVHGLLSLEIATGTRVIDVGESASADPDLAILADISNPLGQAGAAPAIAKTGAGRLLLAGANSFVRSVRVSAGALQLGGDQALGLVGSGNGAQVLAGAALELQAGVDVGDEPLQLAGHGPGSTGALRSLGGSTSWAGAVTLTAPASIAVDAGTLQISGAISGSGLAAPALTVRGPGALELTAVGTYGDGTRVEGGGRLVVNNAGGSVTGPGPVTVGDASTLAGVSQIAGLVTVESGGALEPGTSVGTLGTAGAELSAGSTLRMEIGGATAGQYDQLVVTGPLTVAGTLEITLVNSFVPETGNSFALITHSGLSGTFAATTLPTLPPGLSWELAYEPTAFVARVTGTVGVWDVPSPTATVLQPASPNPVFTQTTLRYELARPGRVDLEVFDVSGRRVATLVEGASLPAGRHEQRWPERGGSSVPPGAYIVRLRVDGTVIEPARRLTVLP